MKRAIAVQTRLIACACILFAGALLLHPICCLAQSSGSANKESGAPAAKISTDYFVAWWMHDATGYHPAVYLILENTSGGDLSYKPIKFQALFRDIKNGYVTVARKEFHAGFLPGQDVYALLEGPTPFELPIDKNMWPQIECKVLCRIGNVDSDSATQDLLITNIEQEAMTDEEAMNRLTDYSHPHMLSRRHRTPSEHGEPVKPLLATALPLASGLHPKSATAPDHHKATLTHFLSMSRQIGLGDDYYDFEQAFGKPDDFSYTHETKWTWARYSNQEPLFTLLAGSRGHSSKIDTVLAVIPADQVQQDSQLLALAKSLSGKLKNEPLSAPIKTVKYLNSGRIQLTTASAPGYKVFYTSPRGTTAEENSYVLGVSRVPGDFRANLAESAKRTGMLRFLSPVVADTEQE